MPCVSFTMQEKLLEIEQESAAGEIVAAHGICKWKAAYDFDTFRWKIFTFLFSSHNIAQPPYLQVHYIPDCWDIRSFHKQEKFKQLKFFQNFSHPTQNFFSHWNFTEHEQISMGSRFFLIDRIKYDAMNG